MSTVRSRPQWRWSGSAGTDVARRARTAASRMRGSPWETDIMPREVDRSRGAPGPVACWRPRGAPMSSMSMVHPIVMLLAGLVVLLRGARDLVEGASGLALRLGVSPLLVGLTVVAFGTSTPELVTSLLGALRALDGDVGAASIVVGNMIGSNSCNVGIILGASAVIAPIAVSPVLRRRDVPLLLLVTAVLAALAWTTGLGRPAGIVLLATFTGCTWALLRSELRGRHAEHGESVAVADAREEVAHHSAARSALEVAVGLALLVLGSAMLVDGAMR